MNITKRNTCLFIGLLGFSVYGKAQAGLPLWTFEPVTGFPPQVTVSPTGTATIKYTVTNQSHKPHTLTFQAIKGISSSGCTSSLQYHESCTLILTVNGSALTENVVNGPVLCDEGNTNQCYRPSAANILRITRSSAGLVNKVIVGSYRDVSSNFLPLSYLSADGGINWTVSSTLPQPADPNFNVLAGVSCTSNGLTCTSVGFSNFPVYFPVSYFTLDGGNTWSRSQAISLPPSGTTGQFYMASCSNSLACAVVGSYRLSGVWKPLSYTSSDGGNHWNVSTTLPAAQGAQDNNLYGVACDTNVQKCVAVGSYYEQTISSTAPLSYISTDGGASWTASSSMPPFTGSGTSILQSVACDSSGLKCVAVGYATSTKTYPIAYTSSNGGDTWTLSATPPPAQGTDNNFIYGVSCDSTGLSCVTVGKYDSSPNNIPLAYKSVDGGVHWTLSSAIPSSLPSEVLYGVHCQSDGAICVATSLDDIDNPLGFGGGYYSLDMGATWTAITISPYSQAVASAFTGTA